MNTVSNPTRSRSGFGRLWQVVTHEYLVNVAKPSFFFGAIGVPLLIFAITAFITWLGIQSEEDRGRIEAVGYVDGSGILANPIDVPPGWSAYPDETSARAALDSDALDAYFLIPADYLQQGNVRLVASTGTPEVLEDDLDDFLIANLSADLAPDVRARIEDAGDVSLRTLDSGRTVGEAGILGVFFLPFVFVMIFIIASSASSGYLMSSVVEEKSNRVMEILVTAITPLQLLGGKIIGLGLVGLTMLALWALVGGIGLLLGRNTQFVSGISIPPDLLILSIIYFILGYFLTGSIMAGIGAVVGTEQESRQIGGILSLLNVIPLFFFFNFITDPNGTVPTILTLIPFTAPLSALLRLGYGAVPAWQLAASLLILLLTTVFTMWASARVFRWSLLLYGKRPSLRQIIRAIRSRDMATTATGDSSG